MSDPIEYDSVDAPVYGGLKRAQQDYESAQAIVLPVAVDRTTSYVPGTRNGPREILLASSHMELWDEELRSEPAAAGVYTLPEMEMPFGELSDIMLELERVAGAIFERPQVPDHAGRRAFHHSTGRGRRRAALPRPVRAPDRCARRLARHLHGHPLQPRVRDAADARARADRSGGRQEPVVRGSSRDPRARDDNVL